MAIITIDRDTISDFVYDYGNLKVTEVDFSWSVYTQRDPDINYELRPAKDLQVEIDLLDIAEYKELFHKTKELERTIAELKYELSVQTELKNKKRWYFFNKG